MKVVEIPYDRLDPVYQKCVDAGYTWGCQCGESYTAQEHAENCRKCRTYLMETPETVYYTPKPVAKATSADNFRICFNDVGITEALAIFNDEVTESIVSNFSILVNFKDNSEFSYFI